MIVDYISYIPRSKTRIKDCTILELLHNEYFLQNFLKQCTDLSEDEQACYMTLINRNQPYHPVNNFRSLKIALIQLDNKLGVSKSFIEGEQLEGRQLDPKSSQWESANVLLGYPSDDKRYHVEIARDVLKRWNNGERQSLFNTPDENYTRLLDYVIQGKRFDIDNCEMAVFATCMEMMSLEDGINMCPTWKHHEEDRTIAIEKALKQMYNRELITSGDHRIVIGIALRARELGKHANFKHPESVNKSFPLFWKLMDEIGEKA